jgi:hypothetical protein
MQKHRNNALQDEVNNNVQHRERILLSSYTPGLDVTTDAKLVKSLTDLIH